ncbi:GNAT family N-acetyltransferase [Paraclostridium tenue]
MDDYIIKTAKSEDIEKIIDLIYSTEPNPTYEWGYGSEIEQKEKLKKLLNLNNCRFKLDNILICKYNNEFCGILLSLGGKRIKKETLIAYLQLIQYEKSICHKILFTFNTFLYLFYKECSQNDYYISNIALLKKFRGIGLSEKLLNAAYKLAKEEGYNRICLHANNDKLVNYYKTLGFSLINSKTKKMTKDLL